MLTGHSTKTQGKLDPLVGLHERIRSRLLGRQPPPARAGVAAVNQTRANLASLVATIPSPARVQCEIFGVDVPGAASDGAGVAYLLRIFRKGLPTEECQAIEKTQKRKGLSTGPGSGSPD
jgi:hypothetical protein